MSKKRNDRKHKGRPAEEPETFPKSRSECEHLGEGGQWNVGAQVAVIRDPAHVPLPKEDQRILGHVLHIAEMRCLDCGQEFRFANLRTEEDGASVAKEPIAMNHRRDMHVRIEPDRLLVTVAQDARDRAKPENRRKIVRRGIVH